VPNELHRLIARCLDGDQAAMLELVQRYQGQVFGLCYRMLGQRQDAEDMAQEAFVRALRNLHRFDPERGFEPWLMAIAANRCRTLLATRMRRPVPSPLVEQLGDDSHDNRAAANLSEEVSLALDQIRDEYKRAFLLFHEQEMSYAEIGAALNCPLGTVKTWVHRARRDLIEHLRRRGVLQETRHALRGV
jgi:RNA polymerase sigma-70 factor (ECF subfamily)